MNKLDNSASCYNLVCYYQDHSNTNKAICYYTKTAYMGNIAARFTLANIEPDREMALKYFEIEAKCGHKESMTNMLNAYRMGEISKVTLENIMRVHHDSITASTSDNRTKWEFSYHDMGLTNGIPEGEHAIIREYVCEPIFHFAFLDTLCDWYTKFVSFNTLDLHHSRENNRRLFSLYIFKIFTKRENYPVH